jgi:hypothetical protein
MPNLRQWRSLGLKVIGLYLSPILVPVNIPIAKRNEIGFPSLAQIKFRDPNPPTWGAPRERTRRFVQSSPAMRAG